MTNELIIENCYILNIFFYFLGQYRTYFELEDSTSHLEGKSSVQKRFHIFCMRHLS